ncbi:MAG TPA: hypothetical protein VF677_11835 [Flavobacterium sp.]|jgi:hypothetical protein
MYTQESISFLLNRIGWGRPLQSGLVPAISSENLLANSGRTVSSFHQLASVENLYNNISEVNANEVLFNEFLADMKRQSVVEVLTSILDQHFLYQEEIDYSETIIQKARLFDDAIGYSIAIKCLELFISSTRSNASERSNAFSFQTLKVELEGARNDNGHFIAKGIIYKKERAILKAQRIIFPDPIVVIGDSIW